MEPVRPLGAVNRNPRDLGRYLTARHAGRGSRLERGTGRNLLDDMHPDARLLSHAQLAVLLAKPIVDEPHVRVVEPSADGLREALADSSPMVRASIVAHRPLP